MGSHRKEPRGCGPGTQHGEDHDGCDGQRTSVPRREIHSQPCHCRPLHRAFTKGVPRNSKRAVVRPKACECDTAGHGKPKVARYSADDGLVLASSRQANPPVQHVGMGTLTAPCAPSEISQLALPCMARSS